MTFVITDLCLRDGGCVDSCPVSCIVPGKPVDKYPLFYIDPEMCIDCGACVPECPYGAIFQLQDLPTAYIATGQEYLSAPMGTPGFDKSIIADTYDGFKVEIPAVRKLKAGEEIDFTPTIKLNRDYFENGPGYSAAD